MEIMRMNGWGESGRILCLLKGWWWINFCFRFFAKDDRTEEFHGDDGGDGDDDEDDDDDGDDDNDDHDPHLVVVPLPKNFMSPPSIISQKQRGM